MSCVLSDLRGHRGCANISLGFGGPGKGQAVVPDLQAGPEEWDGRGNVSEMPFIEPRDFFLLK